VSRHGSAGTACLEAGDARRILNTVPLPADARRRRFLGLSGGTLEKHRTFGTGPRYRKIGGRVIYALSDLEAWADLGTQVSTTDENAGRVRPARALDAAAAHA
jgi:hypothetical protein